MEYKTLSKRVKLLLDHEEGYDVDFKESASGLSTEDIVAFANSSKGGTILIGVKEIKTVNGRQKGQVVGCRVGDKEKLSILNRAESCIPPVEIEIIVENAGRKPFFRVEIPSGKVKPYSTSGGTYKIRGNGRTNPLLPSRLLLFFMENESLEFTARFKKATQDLETNLADIKIKTLREMNQLLGNLYRLEETVDQISSSATSAEEAADIARDNSDSALIDTQDIKEALERLGNVAIRDLETKVDAILNKLGIEDPIFAERRDSIKLLIAKLYLKGYRGKKLVETVQRFYWSTTETEIVNWLNELKQKIKKSKKAK